MRGPVISRRRALAAGLGVGLGVGLAAAGAPPARAADPGVVTLTAEDGREVRVSTWTPHGRERGVMLFSHGALSAPWKYQRLLDPWSALGFRVLAPLHVDSTDHPDHARYGLLDGWRARVLDMRAVSRFAAAPRYVAAGHSWGALVALTLGGAHAVLPTDVAALRDEKVTSVVAFSPPGPSPGLVTAEDYAHLVVPAFVETGTADIPPGGTDWRVHLTAFEQSPPGDKYAAVLPGVDHYFGDLICRPERAEPPQTSQLDQAVALSSDFLRGFGLQERAARDRLDRAFAAGAPEFLRK